MAPLPDELWTKILGLGVENQVLDYRDLCSLAFVCRRIRRISSEDSIWRALWERDQVDLRAGFGFVSWRDSEIESFRDFYRVRWISLLCYFDVRMVLVTLTLLNVMSLLGSVSLCACFAFFICGVTGKRNILIRWFPIH